MKRQSLKSMRENALYTDALILKGNGKLKDYTDIINGVIYRYAQLNTRAVIDCPFRSIGCEAVCYATKGNHVFPSVKNSRERSFRETLRPDFAEALVYTIRTEKQSARYKNAVMIVRVHESGDFYSLQYLRKSLRAWVTFNPDDGVKFVFYTKSFRFFLMSTDDEKRALNKLIGLGVVAMNLSMDDTTTPEQKRAYLEMIVTFPRANTYYCTEHVDDVEHDDVCDCADCAKCGTCNKGTGRRTVVKIHSASSADMDVYRANVNK